MISGKTVVVDLKPAYTSYCDGGSDTTSLPSLCSVPSGDQLVSLHQFPADGVTGMIILNDPSPEITPPEIRMPSLIFPLHLLRGVQRSTLLIPSAILRVAATAKTDVVMKHYTNDTWQNLPTYFVGEELGAVSYMATTTNFTPLAIVYETGGATVADTGGSQKTSASDETAVTPTVDETQPVGEETVATGEEPTISRSEGTTAETEATATKSPAPLVGMLIGLV